MRRPPRDDEAHDDLPRLVVRNLCGRCYRPFPGGGYDLRLAWSVGWTAGCLRPVCPACRGPRRGLVDGPVYERIFKSLKGVSIVEPDPLASFQGQAVFHDDYHDYSTDEPTMDGTASAILMFALLNE